MTAVILGAQGQLGAALIATAPPAQHVVALGRSQCDLTHREDLVRQIAAARPNLVLNAAAYTAVDAAESDAQTAQLVNATAVGWAAAASRSAGARFVHVSTDFVFDGESSRPYAPDDEPRPRSVYARTKLAGERAALAADPDGLVVRTSWVYAASGRNFVLTMLRAMKERNEVRVVADQVGTPTLASGLAQALWSLALGGAAGVLHYSDAGVASWYDFAVAIQEEALALGLLQQAVPVVPIATEDWPTAAVRPRFSVLDKRLTWAQLGKVAPHWRVGLRSMLREVQQRG